jgi:hypothetical protein
LRAKERELELPPAGPAVSESGLRGCVAGRCGASRSRLADTEAALVSPSCHPFAYAYLPSPPSPRHLALLELQSSCWLALLQTARHRLEPLDQQLYRFRRRSPITEGLDTESAVWSYVESDQILRICRICVTAGGTRRGKVEGARQLHSSNAGSAACQSPLAPLMRMHAQLCLGALCE